MTTYLTNQEIFDKVATHLLRQNQRCQAPSAMACSYRNDFAGTRCAIGALIHKRNYDSQMEGNTVNQLFNHYDNVMRASRLHRRSLPLLGELQRLHDDYNPWRWINRLKKMAKRYRLSQPPLLAKKEIVSLCKT